MIATRVAWVKAHPWESWVLFWVASGYLWLRGPGLFFLVFLLWMLFRAGRWVARKLAICGYGDEEGSLCADPHWPKQKLSWWWQELVIGLFGEDI